MDITARNVFISYLEDAVGKENAAVALEAFGDAPSVSVRNNPFKKYSVGGVPVPWCDEGFILSSRPVFTLDPAFHSGAYYVQDSSSMYVGNLVERMLAVNRAGSGILKVLDLCAAPGGKSTHLATVLRKAVGDNFILVSNEVMKQRAGVLADNIAVWGDPNVVVTSADPSAFSSLPGYFDIIVADVPCSGEGMFRKDVEAANQWTPYAVQLCAARQKRIVADVWDALMPGGLFIYSTCTFNKFENDDNVDWITLTFDSRVVTPDTETGAPSLDFKPLRLKNGISLLPGLVPGEGQYCAVIQKNSDVSSHSKYRTQPLPLMRDNIAAKFLSGSYRTLEKNDVLIAVPEVLIPEMEKLSLLKPILRGVRAGEMKGKDFIPHADLALDINLLRGAFPEVEIDRDKALAFLHRDNLILNDAEKGHVLLVYQGLPLGFVKNIGSRTNNLHPVGRRIRMEVANMRDADI